MKLFPVVALAACLGVHAETKVLFSEDFNGAGVGDLPDTFLILDGQFSVKEDAGNKMMELPGAPLESFGVLFGSNQTDGVEVTAKIFGTKTGRKFPTFAAGLNGVGGYKVRVSPAKNAVELVRGDDVKATVPFKWTSGEWTKLRLAVTKTDGGWHITAKAWQGADEPADWMLTVDDKDKLPTGKSGVWGMPFSGTPIRFDDLKVATLG